MKQKTRGLFDEGWIYLVAVVDWAMVRSLN